MANLYEITVKTSEDRKTQVVANSPEEAQTKVTLAEGETLASVEDKGEVVL